MEIIWIKNNWIRSITVNLVIAVVVMVFTDMSYETNDDYAISCRISTGDPFVGFVNYGLCYILVVVQRLFSGINVFVLLQIAASFASLVIILKTLLDRIDDRLTLICIALVIICFSFDLYSVIQFTKTSAVILCAGTLLLIDSLTGRQQMLDYIIALLMICIGSALRIENLPVAVGFAVIYLIVWVIENRSCINREEYLSKGKIISYFVILIFLASNFGAYGISNMINAGTPEREAYQKYNVVRSEVVDYSQYQHYDEYEDDYNASGLDKNDLYLIDNWYFDYNGAASYEKLKAVDTIYDKSRNEHRSAIKKMLKTFFSGIKKNITDLDQTGNDILIMLSVAFLAIVVLKPRDWVYVLLFGAAVLCIYYSLYYIGRVAYRASFAADISATIWILYTMQRYRLRDMPTIRWWKIISFIAVSLLLCIGILLKFDNGVSRYESIEKRIRPVELSEKIASDKEHIYVFSAREKNNPVSYRYPLSEPEPDENVISFGSWGTKSPYVSKKIGAYGLNNLFGDIIDNDKVYVIEDKNVERMEEYLNKWYSDSVEGREIRYVKKDEVDGYSIWKIVSLEEKTRP